MQRTAAAQQNLPVLFLAMAFAAFMLYLNVAAAAPRAESPVECGMAADMAVVARSLSQEQIHRPQTDAIMSKNYHVSQSDRRQPLMHGNNHAAANQTPGTHHPVALETL